jgi:hypothetical protein
LAPQPTANIATATRRQLPGNRAFPGTTTAAMPPNLTLMKGFAGESSLT